eukprot:s5824_g9.t1
MKRPASSDAQKAKAKAAKYGDDPLTVRRQLFEAGGLMVPNAYEVPQLWTLAAPGIGKFAKAKPVELIYFALRSLGHLPQMCLEYAGYPYMLKVVTSPEFREKLKPTLIFGRLPLLRTLKGTELVQSKAILRYVANVCGLAGKGEDERASCDMLHEMLQTEGKVDGAALAALQPDRVTALGTADMKAISRREFLDFDSTQKTVAALKCWSDLLEKSSGWLLGSLAGKRPGSVSYVDLALYWELQEHVQKLQDCGFPLLASYVQKVEGLKGVQRFLESNRMMPKTGDGYLYVGDRLVPKPED